jgi:hypothetical protein
LILIHPAPIAIRRSALESTSPGAPQRVCADLGHLRYPAQRQRAGKLVARQLDKRTWRISGTSMNRSPTAFFGVVDPQNAAAVVDVAHDAIGDLVRAHPRQDGQRGANRRRRGLRERGVMERSHLVDSQEVTRERTE